MFLPILVFSYQSRVLWSFYRLYTKFQLFILLRGYFSHFWVIGVSQPFFKFVGQVGLLLVLGVFHSFSLNNTLYFLQFWCFLRIQGYCGLFLGFKGISVIFLASRVFQPFFWVVGVFRSFSTVMQLSWHSFSFKGILVTPK